MSERDTLELLLLARNSLNSDIKHISNCGESLLSYLILHLREEKVSIPRKLSPYVNDLVKYDHDPIAWIKLNPKKLEAHEKMKHKNILL